MRGDRVGIKHCSCLIPCPEAWAEFLDFTNFQCYQRPSAGTALQPDTVSFSIARASKKVCSFSGSAAEVSSPFGRLAIERSLHEVITACEKGGRTQEAMQLIFLMKELGLTLDAAAFSASISACQRLSSCKKCP